MTQHMLAILLLNTAAFGCICVTSKRYAAQLGVQAQYGRKWRFKPIGYALLVLTFLGSALSPQQGIDLVAWVASLSLSGIIAALLLAFRSAWLTRAALICFCCGLSVLLTAP